MSWLQDLAGKAENILTKIDQNAATVLHSVPKHSNGTDAEPLIEVTSGDGLVLGDPEAPSFSKPSFTTKAPLVLSSPKNVSRAASASHERSVPSDSLLNINVDSGSMKSEKFNGSSRRSSISSRRDGTVIEIAAKGPSESYDVHCSVDKELAATKILLAEIKSERDELKVELESALTELANAEGKTKIQELEELCQTLLKEKNDLNVNVMQIEESNAKYIKSISELESIVSKHNSNEQELIQKLNLAKMETDNAKSELQQYRVRAHATLQLKEQMIEQLKENSNGTDNADELRDGSSIPILKLELDQLKSERLSLLEEITSLNEKYERGKSLWQTMENKLRDSMHAAEVEAADLSQKLNVETTKAHQLSDDLNIRQKELASAREEVVKQRTTFLMQLHERDAEINKLRNKIHSRRTVSPSSDLENRLSSLTQSLVQKQSSLESITAERNALKLQLEKLDAQYRSTVTQIRQQRVPYMSSNETDDAKSQVPNFMVENPFDNKVARRVKRAYSSLDSIGIRLGVFLRRYPLIRILVIVYVAVLHLWVMFVLLSSTPT
ncbi:golgin-84 [Uranotaenia lowii]|uniref:golgin-84 n=1 Tax=Uranotaenia lowii TaxID=190385 RepID=UPI00247B1B73|nr:golgin-84 [Uranotaenia lowii]